MKTDRLVEKLSFNLLFYLLALGLKEKYQLDGAELESNFSSLEGPTQPFSECECELEIHI